MFTCFITKSRFKYLQNHIITINSQLTFHSFSGIYSGRHRVEETSGFKCGDVVGCTISPVMRNKATLYNIQFCKNGKNVGSEWGISNKNVYPTIAMYSKNAKVKASFGKKAYA